MMRVREFWITWLAVAAFSNQIAFAKEISFNWKPGDRAGVQVVKTENGRTTRLDYALAVSSSRSTPDKLRFTFSDVQPYDANGQKVLLPDAVRSAAQIQPALAPDFEVASDGTDFVIGFTPNARTGVS